jgi:hypothetical protein
LHAYLTPARMTMGPIGELRRVRIRGADDHTDHVLPMISLELYGHQDREPRPTSGSELAPGISYIDLDALPMTAWKQMLPAIEHAKGLILDLRGYVNRTTLEILAAGLTIVQRLIAP